MELETGGVLIKFTRTAAETGGVVHIQEARYPAHSTAPPLHRHPKQDERFEVLQGSLHFHVDGQDRIVPAGQELVVRKGLSHCAYNPGDTEALVLWETRPALRTAAFFWAMSRASRGRSRPRLWEAAAILSE